MKFAHYLTTLERDAPKQWKGKFLQYKKLKKVLKTCVSENGGEVDKDAEAAFFEEIEKELRFVNEIFFKYADSCVAKYKRRTRGLVAWVFSSFFQSEKNVAQMAKEVYWCRKYARANAVALRKILKKHDKTCRNRLGREYLQKCWGVSVSESIGLFLHSPLLDELKAVQEKLQKSLVEDIPPDPNEDSKSAYPLHADEEESNQNDGERDVMSRDESGQHNKDTAEEPSSKLEIENRKEPQFHRGTSGIIFPPKSETTPSLRMLREEALRAIEESPTCLLDSSDIDWEEDSPVAQHGLTSEDWPVLKDGRFIEKDAEDGKRGKREKFNTGIDPDAPVPSRNVSSLGSSGHPSSGVGPGRQPFNDDELKCPICLELLYRPVGLSCGHKFCRQCALDAAGFGKVFGAFRNIISYIPSRMACPQCRQKGAYKGAVSLKELSLLIKERYPKEWAERREEDKIRRRNFFEAPSPPRDRPAYPFDLLRV
ncbi:hypothetical protein M9434_003616 [Picochlorum sp. BPE23]|nr:hypothetical protein M9434_003616 [Picochlorum sp. BPE23]